MQANAPIVNGSHDARGFDLAITGDIVSSVRIPRFRYMYKAERNGSSVVAGAEAGVSVVVIVKGLRVEVEEEVEENEGTRELWTVMVGAGAVQGSEFERDQPD